MVHEPDCSGLCLAWESLFEIGYHRIEGPHCLVFDLVQKPCVEMVVYYQEELNLCAGRIMMMMQSFDTHLVDHGTDCPGLCLA
jgi:hypothetical protein